MAKFVALFFCVCTVFNSIAFASGTMSDDRRDRNPIVESKVHSPRYSDDTMGSVETRRKRERSEERSSTPTSSEQVPEGTADGKTKRHTLARAFMAGLNLYEVRPPDLSAYKGEISEKDCLDGDGSKVYCNSLRIYPEQAHLEKLIKAKYSNFKSHFYDDVGTPKGDKLARAMGESEKEYLCGSKSLIIYPQSGVNAQADWIQIVNMPGYRQGLRIEQCTNPGEVCGEKVGMSLPNKFVSVCEQSFMYRTLVAYKNETIMRDSFKVPSCCKCALKTVL